MNTMVESNQTKKYKAECERSLNDNQKPDEDCCIQYLFDKSLFDHLGDAFGTSTEKAYWISICLLSGIAIILLVVLQRLRHQMNIVQHEYTSKSNQTGQDFLGKTKTCVIKNVWCCLKDPIVPIYFLDEYANKSLNLLTYIALSGLIWISLYDKQIFFGLSMLEAVTKSLLIIIPTSICVSLIIAPVFVTLNMRNGVAWTIGALYCWFLLFVQVVWSQPCIRYYQQTVEDCDLYFIAATVTNVITKLPEIFALIYICIFQSVRVARFWLKHQCADCMYNLKKKELLLSQENYVRFLLKRNTTNRASLTDATQASDTCASEEEVLEPTFISRLGNFFTRQNRTSKNYVPGFHYPQAVILSIFLAILFIIKIALLWSFQYDDNYEILLRGWGRQLLGMIKPIVSHNQYPNDGYQKAESFNKSWVFEQLHFGWSTTLNLRAIFYVSVCIAVIFDCTSLLCTIRHFHNDILRLYRGKHNHIANIEVNRTPTFVMAENILYIGYQIGYAFFGFIIHLCTVLLIMTITCPLVYGAFSKTEYDMKDAHYILNMSEGTRYVIPCEAVEPLYNVTLSGNKTSETDGNDSQTNLWQAGLQTIALVFLLFMLPYVVYIPVRMFHVAYITEYIGIGKKHIFAIQHRRYYENLQFLALMIYMPIGTMSALFRVLKQLAMGLWTLPRCDISTMARVYEFCDAGYWAYVCMLYTQLYHSHPIMLVFLNEICAASSCKFQRGDNYFVPGELHKPVIDSVNSNDLMARHPIVKYVEAADLFSEALSKRRTCEQKRAMTRWHLLVTLVNNPSLTTLRKKHLMHVRDLEESNKPLRHHGSTVRKWGDAVGAVLTSIASSLQQDNKVVQIRRQRHSRRSLISKRKNTSLSKTQRSTLKKMPFESSTADTSMPSTQTSFQNS